MTSLRMGPRAPIKGTVEVPGDKSLSHRAILLGALADGPSRITGFLDGRDCHATVGIMRDMGVAIDFPQATEARIDGVGLHGLREPEGVLYADNSGTTMRLLAGLLAGQAFTSVVSGTRQLCRRPMDRVLKPLAAMGAHIHGRAGDRYAPLTFVPAPARLRGIQYDLPVASAQVKSCVLLAGLYAGTETTVVEPGPTRDHTECMLRAMGAAVESDGPRIHLSSPEGLSPLSMHVPGDASSAAFLIVAACLAADSALTLRNVGCNPTRIGIVEALRSMGADIAMVNARLEGGEAVADIEIQAGPLRARGFGGEIIVRMIDELPLLALACTQAEGVSVIRDARELRIKESDRIEDTVTQLRRLGADLEGTPDGFVIRGPTPLRGAEVSSAGDHRLAMMLAVAGLLTPEDLVVRDARVTDDSFPGFAETLCALGAEAVWEERDD